MALAALGSFYLLGILTVLLLIAFPQALTDRRRNAISSGTLLGMGWLAVFVLAKSVGIVHIVVAVPVLIGSAIFAFGYLTPKKLRAPVEKRITHYLDYVALTCPDSVLPWVRRCSFLFGWLGLNVD